MAGRSCYGGGGVVDGLLLNMGGQFKDTEPGRSSGLGGTNCELDNNRLELDTARMQYRELEPRLVFLCAMVCDNCPLPCRWNCEYVVTRRHEVAPNVVVSFQTYSFPARIG